MESTRAAPQILPAKHTAVGKAVKQADSPLSLTPPSPPLQNLFISKPKKPLNRREVPEEFFSDVVIQALHPQLEHYPKASNQFDDLPLTDFPVPIKKDVPNTVPVPKSTLVMRSHGGSPPTRRRSRRKALHPYKSAPVTPHGSRPSSPTGGSKSLFFDAPFSFDLSKTVLEAVDSILEMTPMIEDPQPTTGLAVVDAAYEYDVPHGQSNLDAAQRISIIDYYVRISAGPYCRPILPREATDAELLSCHARDYISSIERATPQVPLADLHGYSREVLDVEDRHELATAARLACGATIDAALAVATGVLRNSFVMCRPAGHMAHYARAQGYSVFNNVAVAAKACLALPKVHRIMIVDFDHRHGSGTEELFRYDKNVLVVSVHRHDNGGFFPGTGAIEDVGSGLGTGYNVNIAWHTNDIGMGDSEYIAAFSSIILPISVEFAPDMIFISAGFDGCGHANIPPSEGGFHLSPAVYGYLTRMLMSSVNGKVVTVLEGGADPMATGMCVPICLDALRGAPLPVLPEPARVPNPACISTLSQVVSVHSPYWKSLSAASKLAIKAPSQLLKFRHEDDAMSYSGYKFCPTPLAPVTPILVRQSTTSPSTEMTTLDEEDCEVVANLLALKHATLL
eukprot:m.26501 g.26501  ORF g.26501 m.26501 type:complete len:625 (-) comp10057_c1_seq1:1011-2885(-)